MFMDSLSEWLLSGYLLHCVVVRIQLVHLLKILVHLTLSLVRHHEELHTLVSKGPFQHGEFKVTVNNRDGCPHTTYCAKHCGNVQY